MIWQFWAAIATALISSGVSPVAVPKILEWRKRKETQQREQEEKDKAAEDQRLLLRKEAEDDRRDRERTTWMRDSKKAFNRVDRDCTICTRKLERMGNAFFTVMERLEDQVIPSLGPDMDIAEVRRLMREIIHKGRSDALAPILIPPLPNIEMDEQQ